MFKRLFPYVIISLLALQTCNEKPKLSPFQRLSAEEDSVLSLSKHRDHITQVVFGYSKYNRESSGWTQYELEECLGFDSLSRCVFQWLEHPRGVWPSTRDSLQGLDESVHPDLQIHDPLVHEHRRLIMSRFLGTAVDYLFNCESNLLTMAVAGDSLIPVISPHWVQLSIVNRLPHYWVKGNQAADQWDKTAPEDFKEGVHHFYNDSRVPTRDLIILSEAPSYVALGDGRFAKKRVKSVYSKAFISDANGIKYVLGNHFTTNFPKAIERNQMSNLIYQFDRESRQMSRVNQRFLPSISRAEIDYSSELSYLGDYYLLKRFSGSIDYDYKASGRDSILIKRLPD